MSLQCTGVIVIRMPYLDLAGDPGPVPSLALKKSPKIFLQKELKRTGECGALVIQIYPL